MTDSSGAEASSISKNIQRIFNKNKPLNTMKPVVVADEMFPEGIDIEEVSIQLDNRKETWLFTFLQIVFKF